MRTVPVQVVCKKCANPYRTTVRGGNTRCPHCRASRHVRIDQEWEGPVPSKLSGAASRAAQVATRPAVWVQCRCGHEWQSRARDRMTIRCPECGTGQRVPYRTHANTGPAPEGYRPPAVPRARTGRPAPAWEPYDAPAVEPEQPRFAVPYSDRSAPSRTAVPAAPLGGLAGILAALGNRRPAAPAPVPAPAPHPAAPNRPALLPTAPTGAAIEPIDVHQLATREQRRRETVCQVTSSLCAPFKVWYDQPPGLCEALDTSLPSDRKRCPGTATHAVRFVQDVTEVDAYTCPAHARPLATIADRSPYITATLYALR